uniref:Heat shock protein beta-1 n=1 Tax=Hemiscolopendra marginata TaxID=943146 RepID=A0A646QFG5_9MYRI
MAPERRVPILRTDFSILDSEYNSIREHFEQEMKKMEDEMAKFRSNLLAQEQHNVSRSTTSFSSGTGTTSETHKSEFKTWIDGMPQEFQSQQSHEQKQEQFQSTGNNAANNVDESKTTTTSSSSTTQQGATTHRSELRTWLDGLESPLIKEGDSGKEIKLRFDVSQYTPEEIVVKTVDNKLQVQAKHEEKTENRSVYREYNREFLLPKGTNPELIKSSLSKDGVLTVEAPLPVAIEGERLIPIDKS